MTREEAHKYPGSTLMQVCQMLLHNDKTEGFYWTLCAVGVNKGGWKKARCFEALLEGESLWPVKYMSSMVNAYPDLCIHSGYLPWKVKCHKVAITTGKKTSHERNLPASYLIVPV